MTVFGPILGRREVEQAAQDTLKLWIPTYLREIERLTGRDPYALPPIRSWTRKNELEDWPDNQLPLCLLISPGLAEPPWRDGQGHYTARWTLGVAIVVSSTAEDKARELADAYGKAVRLTLTQHPSLGGLATASDWMDERYDDLPSEAQTRTLGIQREAFRVEVPDVGSALAGPAAPDEAPGDWPNAVDPVTVTIERRSDA